MMPGFALHLAAAKILLNKQGHGIESNSFLVGNLLPDAASDKQTSHFRTFCCNKKVIRCPELNSFLRKYECSLDNSYVLGYYYHLYIDWKFFVEYLPKLLLFLDEGENIETEREKVEWVYIKRTGEKVQFKQFYSEDYYYGDFTKMNAYLIERYQIPTDFKIDIDNWIIEEVDYGEFEKLIKQFERYAEISIEAVEQLRVFDIADLIEFLEVAATEWVKKSCFKPRANEKEELLNGSVSKKERI